MATYTYVELELEEAKLLADLFGIDYDLRKAISYANNFFKYYPPNKDSIDIIEALSVSSIVFYSRPFMSGVREKLDVMSLDGLSSEDILKHNHIIALRSKHIAHSVNEYEENKVHAYYKEENPYEHGITSVSVGSGRVSSMSGDEANNIINLSEKIISIIEVRTKAENKRLLELVRGMPIEEVLSYNRSAFTPDYSNACKPRKK